MVLDGLHADGGRQMGFAGARTSDENYVLAVFQELAAMQRFHQRLIDKALTKVEASEIPVGRELGRLHLVVDGAYFPLRKVTTLLKFPLPDIQVVTVNTGNARGPVVIAKNDRCVGIDAA